MSPSTARYAVCTADMPDDPARPSPLTPDDLPALLMPLDPRERVICALTAAEMGAPSPVGKGVVDAAWAWVDSGSEWPAPEMPPVRGIDNPPPTDRVALLAWTTAALIEVPSQQTRNVARAVEAAWQATGDADPTPFLRRWWQICRCRLDFIPAVAAPVRQAAGRVAGRTVACGQSSAQAEAEIRRAGAVAPTLVGMSVEEAHRRAVASGFKIFDATSTDIMCHASNMIKVKAPRGIVTKAWASSSGGV